jgi:hypothetical protein
MTTSSEKDKQWDDREQAKFDKQRLAQFAAAKAKEAEEAEEAKARKAIRDKEDEADAALANAMKVKMLEQDRREQKFRERHPELFPKEETPTPNSTPPSPPQMSPSERRKKAVETLEALSEQLRLVAAERDQWRASCESLQSALDVSEAFILSDKLVRPDPEKKYWFRPDRCEIISVGESRKEVNGAGELTGKTVVDLMFDDRKIWTCPEPEMQQLLKRIQQALTPPKIPGRKPVGESEEESEKQEESESVQESPQPSPSQSPKVSP